MMPTNAGMDGYNVKARYLPALITLSPAWLLFVTWYPPDPQLLNVFTSAGVTMVLSVLLAHLARDAGRTRQKKLFSKWGGAPTTLALSFRSGRINPFTLARYHECLNMLIPGISLPGSAEKEAECEAVHHKYASAVDYLREATRDKARFRTVYAANVDYGFRRNLWGMKPTGIVISILAISGIVWHLSREYANTNNVPAIDAATLIFCVSLLAVWILRITKEWVRDMAEEYAERLLAAIETLAPKRETSGSPQA